MVISASASIFRISDIFHFSNTDTDGFRIFRISIDSPIHRDVKASNVLLYSIFQARVADFGFSKLMTDGANHVTTRVKGTLGYLAPKYAMLGRAVESCDIYCFGILLLELASGKKPIEKICSTVKKTIIDWTPPLTGEKKYDELDDTKLNGEFVKYELKRMVIVALVFSQNEAEKRPTMLEVVEFLKGELKEKLVSMENSDLFKIEKSDGVVKDKVDIVNESV